MSKDIVNPDTFETAIGALVPGSVVPVGVEPVESITEAMTAWSAYNRYLVTKVKINPMPDAKWGK